MSVKSVVCLCLCVCLGACAWGKSIFIESENTMGVHRIEGKQGNQVIPVPWTTLGTPDVEPVTPITISNLVSAADLVSYDVDTLRSYNKDEQLFDGWSWDETEWYYPPVFGSEKMLEADKTPIDRGEALWLKLSADMDVYLIGQASTNAPVSRLASGTDKIMESFLANPYDTDVDILTRIEGPILGDRINVVTATNSVMYWYEQPAEGGDSPTWCKLETVIKEIDTPRGKKKTQVTQYMPCGSLMVPPLTGVWYTCVPSEAERTPRIEWPYLKGSTCDD